MKKDIIRVVASIFAFFYLSIFVLFGLMLIFKMEFSENDYLSLVILDFISSGILTIITILINKKILKSELKKLKESKIFGFLKVVFSAFLMMFLFKYIGAYLSTSIGTLFGIEEVTTDNQSLIETLLDSAPALMIISACVFAPINEEVIFRGAIAKVIKNKKVFIAVSGLIFGLMHVTDSIFVVFEILILGVILSFIFENNKYDKNKKVKLSVIASVIILLVFGILYYFQFGNLIIKVTTLDVNEVIGCITYITMGFYLAYLYAEHENIYINIAVHALNNILSMIAILFLI